VPEDRSQCWLWKGATQKPTKRYGKIKTAGRNGGALYTHRVAYALLVGPIPAGKDVHHKLETCDKRCCNPDHLELRDRENHTPDRGGGSGEYPLGKNLEVRNGKAVREEEAVLD
jgi:hypothetical protein